MATEGAPGLSRVVNVVRVARLEPHHAADQLWVERGVYGCVVRVDFARVAEHRITEQHEPRSLRIVKRRPKGLREGRLTLCRDGVEGHKARVSRAVLVVGEVRTREDVAALGHNLDLRLVTYDPGQEVPGRVGHLAIPGNPDGVAAD